MIGNLFDSGIGMHIYISIDNVARRQLINPCFYHSFLMDILLLSTDYLQAGQHLSALFADGDDSLPVVCRRSCSSKSGFANRSTKDDKPE
jgi:hypothetical protein